jgi:hypothetical protein
LIKIKAPPKIAIPDDDEHQVIESLLAKRKAPTVPAMQMSFLSAMSQEKKKPA